MCEKEHQEIIRISIFLVLARQHNFNDAALIRQM